MARCEPESNSASRIRNLPVIYHSLIFTKARNRSQGKTQRRWIQIQNKDSHLADDEDVAQPGGEDMALRILDVADVETAWVLLPGERRI